MVNKEKSMKKIDELDEDMKNILDTLDRIYKKDKDIQSKTVDNIGEEIKQVKNSFNPILVSIGELRQKIIELHTLKTKQGNAEIEITMAKKMDLDLHALLLANGHLGHRMKELESKITTKNVATPSN